ncbi:MAG: sporulation protein YqfD [Lachnospiraceae bacterium]
MNRILLFVTGYYSVKIEGNNIKRLFKACISKNIRLENLYFSNTTIFADVNRYDYSLLEELSNKTCSDLIILDEHGLPSIVKCLFCHKYYVLLTLIILFIFMYLNTRLISFDISGNSYLTEETIIKQLENYQVKKYSDIRKINCAELEEIIINNNPVIKWCSIYTRGNILYVLLDEEPEKNQTKAEQSEYCSLVYGTVKNIYIRSGYPLVQPGDSVCPGDILLTGEIPISNIYDEVIGTRTVIPDCDIEIDFYSQSQIIQPYVSSVRIYNGEIKKGFEISLYGNKLFSYLPSISYETCDIIRENVDLNIFDFSLPLSLITYRVYNVSLQDVSYSYETAEKMLSDKFDVICSSYINSGYTILDEECNFSSTGNCLVLNYKIHAEGPAYYSR